MNQLADIQFEEATPPVDSVVQLDGLVLYHRNEAELRLIHSEIFEDGCYRFECPTPSPRIIDCGSHIGLSVLYFKQHYPDARIIAFEADPLNCTYLHKNIQANQINDVDVIAAAVSNQSATTQLYDCAGEGATWTWGCSIIHNMWGDADKKTSIDIQTVRLSDYIGDETVHLLKLDIEGAEQNVLQDIEPKLHVIEQIILEYHPSQAPQGTNDMETITEILTAGGFELALPNLPGKKDRHNNQLIYAYRPARQD